jgi:hypothetical protein
MSVGDRQVLGAYPFEVVDELAEHLALIGELVSHGPAGGQVVGGGRTEVVRSPPGHGIASPRNARWSTLA